MVSIAHLAPACCKLGCGGTHYGKCCNRDRERGTQLLARKLATELRMGPVLTVLFLTDLFKIKKINQPLSFWQSNLKFD
jgi:hypothetical protein